MERLCCQKVIDKTQTSMEPFYTYEVVSIIGVHVSFLVLDEICYCTVDDFVHHLNVCLFLLFFFCVVTERCASLIVLPCNGMVEYSQEIIRCVVKGEVMHSHNNATQRRRQLPRSRGAHVLNVKLWGCGPEVAHN